MSSSVGDEIRASTMLAVAELPRRAFRIGLDDRLAWLGPSGGGPRTWVDLVHEQDVAEFGAALMRVRADTSAEQSLLVRVSGGGERLRVFLSAGPDGTVLGLAVDAAPESQRAEHYRLGVEASPIGLLMVDATGTIILVNRQMETMFGYERAELLGNRVEMLLPERYRARHPAMMRSFFKAPAARFMGQGRDLYGVRKDGTEFAIEIGLNPSRSGDSSFVLASIVDVTSRKQQEAELRDRVADLQRYRKEMGLLSEMSSLLQHAINKSEAHGIVAAFGKRLLASASSPVSVAVYTARSSGDALELQASWGNYRGTDRFGPQDCWALRRSQPHRMDDDAPVGLPRCNHAMHTAWQSCIPMSAHGQSIGLITISGSEGMDRAEHDNLERVAKAIADQLALAVSNLTLRESLHTLAIRDPLTGLFNRRYLEDTVARELSRSKRHDSRLSVWMIDIDHFKTFNDTYGHQAADDTLADFARRLQAFVRDTDITCRFGGEEFVVVMPDCSRDDAVAQADAFRVAVQKSELGITLSIGVAEYPQDGHSWDMVLRKADSAMYSAKRAGRDRVHAPTDLLEAVEPRAASRVSKLARTSASPLEPAS